MAHYHLGYVSLALYAASFLCYARILYVPDVWVGRVATLLLGAGIVMHYFALLERSRWIHTVPYNDLYGSMSLFAWLLGVTYLGLELFHRQRSVGAFVTLLLIVWIVALAALAPDEAPAPPPARGALFAFHVTLTPWAYAAFPLARCARREALRLQFCGGALQLHDRKFLPDEVSSLLLADANRDQIEAHRRRKIGRASCRERV